jgi:hypothetical protein
VGNSGVTVIDSSGAVAISDAVLVPSLTANGPIVGTSINADVSSARIIIVNSGAGGSTTVTTAVPGLTTNGRVLLQQVSSGAEITPVVAACLANSLVLTADGNFPSNAIYWVYVISY